MRFETSAPYTNDWLEATDQLGHRLKHHLAHNIIERQITIVPVVCADVATFQQSVGEMLHAVDVDHNLPRVLASSTGSPASARNRGGACADAFLTQIALRSVTGPEAPVMAQSGGCLCGRRSSPRGPRRDCGLNNSLTFPKASAANAPLNNMCRDSGENLANFIQLGSSRRLLRNSILT